jgi:hypothetical protein
VTDDVPSPEVPPHVSQDHGEPEPTPTLTQGGQADAGYLAAISRDVLGAWEKTYGTELTWQHPMPGMFQDQELKREAAILEMLQTAYDRLVEHYLASSMHAVMHDRMIADQVEREKKHPPDEYSRIVTDSFEKMQSLLRGEKRVDLEHMTPEQKADLLRVQKQLGLTSSDIPSLHEEPAEPSCVAPCPDGTLCGLPESLHPTNRHVGAWHDFHRRAPKRPE